MKLFGRMSNQKPAQPIAACIGHSHTENLAAAAKLSGSSLDVLNFWHLPGAIETEGEKLQLSRPVRERLIAPVFSLVGGAVHQDVGLIQHGRPFDFVLPDRCDLELAPDAEIIPYDAVRAVLVTRTQYYLNIMRAVREAVIGAMFHFESPPTYADEQVPQDDPGFAQFFGNDVRFSAAWLRYKLWRLHSGIVAEYCAKAGIVFVPAPPAAFDSEGFLLAAYHGKPAHANVAYGQLVLKQLQQLAGQSKRGAVAQTKNSSP